MELIADILLISGAFGTCFYCFILARRLKRFNSLEDGVGGAVAVLSAQVDDLEKTLVSAQVTAAASVHSLQEQTAKATAVARQLELQMASLHDVVPPQNEVVPQPVVPQKKEAKIKPTPPPPPTPSPVSTNITAEPMFVRHSQHGDA